VTERARGMPPKKKSSRLLYNRVAEREESKGEKHPSRSAKFLSRVLTAKNQIRGRSVSRNVKKSFVDRPRIVQLGSEGGGGENYRYRPERN